MRVILPHKETIISDSTYNKAFILLLIIISTLIIRLWHVQIFKGTYYKKLSEINNIRNIDVEAPRGSIFDRNGRLILGNQLSYDLVFITGYAQEPEKSIIAASQLLGLPSDWFLHAYNRKKSQAKYLPIPLKRNLTQNQISLIEQYKYFLPGIDIQSAYRRKYQPDSPGHLLGFLREISQDKLEKIRKKNPNTDYHLGDLIGGFGLEGVFEKQLRGKAGYKYLQVDALGRVRKDIIGRSQVLAEKLPISGNNISLTIDLNLQKVTQQAFKGKNGSVIVGDPRSGEILSLISEPHFDPEPFQDGISFDAWRALIANPFKPLLDKTTGGMYAPGSLYKTVVAAAALEEKVIDTETTFFCDGTFQHGSKVFRCHHRGGHGLVNLSKALMYSCDVFFYNVGLKLGVNKIAEYARDMGIRDNIDLNLNMNSKPIIPTAEWKKKIYHHDWSSGETISVAIGQGYTTVSPLHLFSLFSTIANGGNVWQPTLIKALYDSTGFSQKKFLPKKLYQSKKVSAETYQIIRSGLKEVVMNPHGTGKRAQIPGINVGGKTGTVQVVSLDKYENSSSYNMLWYEHAIFGAMAPIENPEIVVLVFSEHDQNGGGGAAAAPVAQKILDYYFKTQAELQSKKQENKKEQKI